MRNTSPVDTEKEKASVAATKDPIQLAILSQWYSNVVTAVGPYLPQFSVLLYF